MLNFFRKSIKRILWWSNIFIAVLLLLTLLVPYISPSKCWQIGLLGLATPYIAMANIAYIILWMIIGKYRRMLFSTVAIILSWKIFSVGIAGNIAQKNNMMPINKSVKIMSYNVRLLDLYKWTGKKNTRENLLNYIQSKKADVLCLQEFYNSADSTGIQNIKAIADSCNYPYYATNKNYLTKRGFFGDIIFSKYPIIQQQCFALDTSSNTHNFQYADIVQNADTYRVYNLHLKSIRLEKNEYNIITNNELDAKNELLNKGKTVLYKLKKGFVQRGNQADIVNKNIEQSPYPSIACGDFNDLPSSYSYFTIRNKMKDAFLEKGLGFGATFNGISPVLRIDNILFSQEKFTAIGFEKGNETYSDHYPIIANFLLK
jgi:endonuclease/exonuclease/phosphatase family metal-dependent hydrolase